MMASGRWSPAVAALSVFVLLCSVFCNPCRAEEYKLEELLKAAKSRADMTFTMKLRPDTIGMSEDVA